MFGSTRRVILLLLGLCLAGAGWAEDASLLGEFTIRRWAVEDGLPEAVVTAIRQGDDGYLWCTTPRHVVRFDGARFVERAPELSVSAHFESERKLELPPELSTNDVTQSVIESNGVTWVAGRGQLFCRRAGVWSRIGWPATEREETPVATALLVDRLGALWLGTLHGVYRWHGGKWLSLTEREGLFPWDVRCLAEDREGNVWIGTTGGLMRLRMKLLEVFRSGLPTGDETVTALLAESPTNFWVGVAGSGLVNGPAAALRPLRLGALPEHATVSTLCRRRDGTLWVGTLGDGLWRWDADGTAQQVGTTRGISALCEDRQGQLWVGTWEGLMKLTATGTLVAAGELPAEVVTAVCEDRAGRLWVGYQSSGLLCWPAQWVRQQDGLPSDSIRALYADGDGGLWVGTANGLGWLSEGRWQRFTPANGLQESPVVQIVDDDLGYLWLGTRRGIMRVKKTEFAEVAARRKVLLPARVFGQGSGMADAECTGGLGAHAAKTSDGRLWFPTMQGVVMADPQEIPNLTDPPPVYIEEVKGAGRGFAGRARITMPLGVRDLEFNYTAPILTVPSRAYFKHRLDGYDANWSVATGERMVRYPRLPPGAYQFRVMVCDRDGAWSEPAQTTVIIPAFVWETVWCRVGLVMLAAVIVGVGVRFYDKRKTARQLAVIERRHALENERARIARDIHDDVGAGLTEMAMLSELAQDEPGAMREHLDRIFRRSRELTQSLDEIIWAINPRNDTLEGFLSYIAEFAQGFLASAGVACRLDFPRDPPALPMSANVRHHLCLAIKEVLNNILKHAVATEVQVRVDFLRQELSLTIQDNGIGFSEPAAGEGLLNLETRLHELGGQVERISEAGRGTRIRLTVQLPVEPA